MKLKIWNGRWYSKINGKPANRVYVAARSVNDLRNLFEELGLEKPTLSEIKNYWTKGCWGKSMDGIEVERGVWAHNQHTDEVFKVYPKAREYVAMPGPTGDQPFDFIAHINRHIEFSEKTFGPGSRVYGVLDHIRKELIEIESAPDDLEEWIDVIMLALDGAWRSGATAEQIVAQLVAKQAKNESRKWPDWRTAPRDKAIEHDRSEEE